MSKSRTKIPWCDLCSEAHENPDSEECKAKAKAKEQHRRAGALRRYLECTTDLAEYLAEQEAQIAELKAQVVELKAQAAEPQKSPARAQVVREDEELPHSSERCGCDYLGCRICTPEGPK